MHFVCGAQYAPGEVTYTCPKDGGNLDVILDYAAIRKRLGAPAALGVRMCVGKEDCSFLW